MKDAGRASEIRVLMMGEEDYSCSLYEDACEYTRKFDAFVSAEKCYSGDYDYSL